MSKRDIDAYVAALDEPKRSTLEELRRSIMEAVPDADEGLSYGMPAFKVQGKTVAGFAAFTNHLSYLPHSGSVLAELGNEARRTRRPLAQKIHEAGWRRLRLRRAVNSSPATASSSTSPGLDIYRIVRTGQMARVGPTGGRAEAPRHLPGQRRTRTHSPITMPRAGDNAGKRLAGLSSRSGPIGRHLGAPGPTSVRAPTRAWAGRALERMARIVTGTR